MNMWPLNKYDRLTTFTVLKHVSTHAWTSVLTLLEFLTSHSLNDRILKRGSFAINVKFPKSKEKCSSAKNKFQCFGHFRRVGWSVIQLCFRLINNRRNGA